MRSLDDSLPSHPDIGVRTNQSRTVGSPQEGTAPSDTMLECEFVCEDPPFNNPAG